MKTIVLSFTLVTAVLSLMAGLVFTVCTMTTKQIQNKRLVHYKHPCIVLNVDNRGCQAEIEMRTRVVLVPRLPR